MAVTGQDVADFLGQGTDTALVALAGEHAAIISAMVSAYTRGRGFTDGEPTADLAAVITTASARLVANPEQIQSKVGSVEIRGGFQGFNLAELCVLSRYRKTAL